MINALSDRAHYSSLRSCVYLNQASLGLIAQPAVAAMQDFLEQVARHGNMLMSDSDEVAFFEQLRAQAAALLNCPPEQLAILASAGEMLAQLPYLLAPAPGSRVLAVASDFPAITRPWLAHAGARDCGLDFVEELPDQDLTDTLIAAMGPRTAVVAVSYVQFSTGSRCDIPRLRAATDQLGAKLVVDVTQAAGAIPIDAAGWDADVLVCSGYKWLGGHGGVGLAVLSPQLLSLTPPAPGWMGAPDPFAFDATRLSLASDARRFTQSTMSYVSLKGLTVAIAALRSLGLEAVEAHADALASQLLEDLEGTGWAPFRPLGSGAAASHIITLTPRHGGTDAVVAALSEAKVVCGKRNGRVRVSLAHYNDESDLQALIEVLRRLSQG